MRELLRFAMFLMGLMVIPQPAQSQQSTILYVNRADSNCDGAFPCFTTIQAAINAAPAGAIIRIQAGTYRERLLVDGKNNLVGAIETSRIIIESDPSLAAGSVIVRPPDASCVNGYGVLIRRSRFITIRGLTITGATGAGIVLNGGPQQNLGVHIERSRIVANSKSNCAGGGITVALGNPETLIVNTVVTGNGGNGITFAEGSGGPHWVIQNTIHGNSWNGVAMVVGQTILMVNNNITANGQGSGTLGGRYGIARPGLPGQDPQSVRLLNNLICGNRLAEIQGPILDGTDSNNLTPHGNEGSGVSASSVCDLFDGVYADANGPDNLPNTPDDDFRPILNSPSIDRGIDPRTLGLNVAFNTIFEHDHGSEYIRPADANGDRLLTFDIGAFEVANRAPVADAEPDQTTFRGVLVTVNGNQSYDPEGAALTYRWSIVSQPPGSAISLSNPSSATQQFTPLVRGTYIVGLIVNDGQFDSVRDSVQVEVVNRAPSASNGFAATDEDTPVTITLHGADLDSSTVNFTVMNSPDMGSLGATSPSTCTVNGTDSNCTASLIYTPFENFNGVDRFTFKVNDGSTDSNIAMTSIAVNAVNDSPLANGTSASTSEDTPVSITLIASDIDSSNLSFSIVNEPSGGTLGAISASTCIASMTGFHCNATVTYTPAANFNALDRFSFKASDGILDSNVATVSIIINALNDAPRANGVTVLTDEDTPTTITLTADDIDSSNLSFTIVSAPTRGTLGATSVPICGAVNSGVNCTAAVTYTPAANHAGLDSFSFQVNDGTAESPVATVDIRIDALNDAPLAADDVYNTDGATPLVLFAPGVLGNDNDPDSEQSSLTALLVSGPAHSVNFSLNPDGSFSYTPAASFNGIDSFTYQATDGSNDGNTAVVTIDVKAIDDAPVASNDFYNVDKDTQLEVAARGVLANDNDLGTASGSITAILVSGPAHAASFTLNPDGSFTYNPSSNYNGKDIFIYKASDGRSESSAAMVTIAVNFINDSPVAQNDSHIIAEDSVLTVVAPGVLDNDSGVSLNQTVTVELVSGPTRATSFQLNPDGSFHYTPNPEFYGVDTFTYRVSDGSTYSNVAMAQITVTNVNDPPVARSQLAATNENTPAIFTVSASDFDSTTLNFTIVSGPSRGAVSTTSGAMTCTAQGQGSSCIANIGYSPSFNYSGPDSFTFLVSDGLGISNTAAISISVVHVNGPPTANAGGPYIGNVGAPVQFAGSGKDPEGDPISFTWNFGDGATGSGPNPTYTYAAPGTYTITLTVTDSSGAQNTVQAIATISAGVILSPIGNRTVNLGETLTFVVSAMNTSGGPLTLSVAPMPLPVHAGFNTATGIFTFRPDTTQVGSLQLTFNARADNQSASETVTITVPSPAPGGATSVRGQVHNLNKTPLSNVKVTLKTSGHTTFSDTGGFFTLTGVPAGTQQLIVNGREANLGVYAILAVAVDLIAGVTNNLASPITLPDVDVDAEVQVAANFTTVVNNPSLPGVELVIAAGTARNADGTPFTGKLSINPVPDYGRPESRPEELRPGMAVTIQPAGIRFDPPARLTFPNADGIPSGNEFNLWSLNPDTGKFNIVGRGVVSADGQSIITVEGGVSVSAWHFPLAPSPMAAGSQGDSFCGSCRTSVGSEANLEEGSLYVSHSLPSYRSLGRSRSVSLTYSSVTADPRPILSLDARLSLRAAVPNTFSTRLKIGGVQQGDEVFTDARSLPEDSDSSSRLSGQFDASSLPTGRYPYEATVFSNYLNSSIGGIATGHVIVVNRNESPFGSGWAVTDIQTLHPQPGTGVLLAGGDGTALFFSGGDGTFTSPPRDFSTLTKAADNTYVRTFKDGTKIHFNSQGLQTSVVDRIGNATSYSYDATGRLESISDPVGLATIFTYASGKLQRITDPAGRQTMFQFDSAGNLSRVTNPDGTFVAYGYDGQRRITQVNNERGISTTYAYDFAGRFSQSLRPGGETRSLISSKLQGLPNSGSGLGKPTKPAQIVRSENAKASLTDGNGSTTWFTLDSLGQVIAQTDALGQTTSTRRDANGLPTRITRPNGAVTVMTYDLKGNLLTSADPVGAVTTFTYEANFNQVKTIRDPKGNTTTVNYDGNGNAVEIIDALGNLTQMTYDTRGLLTSVTSAVGTPVQTTSSFTYDTRGNLLTSTNAKGEITTLAYDNAGNVFRSTDAESRVTEFTYDAVNRLISVLDADLKQIQYGYDPKGNLVQVRDAKNQISTFTYDGLDRMLSATNPLGRTETFNYDGNGNLITTVNRNGQTLAFNYDALNRLIKKSRPPTSTEIGLQQTVFSYDSVGNLTSVMNPVTNILSQYDLANRLVSTTSTAETVLANAPAQIDTDTTIGAADHQFDGRTLQVNGRVLTIDGSHQFANLILVNGAVLTHSPTTATTAGRLDITVTGVLQIDVTSRIDVTGRGFLGGGQAGNTSPTNGMTVGFQAVNGSGIGAGFGGFGGSSSSTNALYGDFKNPNIVGSGGGAFSGGRGGSGGGLVRIVAQTLSLNGTIRANGGVVEGSAAGGSGGGIRLDVDTISGTGSINANGSAALTAGGGGGGGGRVAVYFRNATTFDFGNATTFGAAFSGGSNNGGAGSVYLQGPGRESGELVFDNSNLVATATSIPAQASGVLTLSHLRVRRTTGVTINDRLIIAENLDVSGNSNLTLGAPVAASSITINGNSVIRHAPATATIAFKLDLDSNSLTIDSSSRIDVTERGFLGGGRPGNPSSTNGMTVGFQAVNGSGTAGTYGGSGGVFSGTSNPPYGDFRNPNEIGSGGGGFNTNAAGTGGGLVRIVAQTLTLHGTITANGGAPVSGGFAAGGSGGGIRIDVGALSGTGSISANGSPSTPSGGGGGGGGRVALYFQNAAGFNLENITASGAAGSGAANGGAGTVFLQGPGREIGELIVDNLNLIAANDSTALFAVPAGPLTLTTLEVRRGAKAKVEALMNVVNDIEITTDARLVALDRLLASTIRLDARSSLDAIEIAAATSFQIYDNSVVAHPPTTGSVIRKLLLNAGTLSIDVTSRIDLTGRGFLGGGQPGNPSSTNGMTLGFQSVNGSGTAGSYGGLGGAFSGTTNPVYGDFHNPNDVGSGGGGFNGNRAGNGGGLVRIVAQTFTLDGVVTANGGAPASGGFAAGGSGGGIRIDAAVLSGTGSISASGSSSTPSGGGGGGGGRIAVYYQSAASFNIANIRAAGGIGSGAPNGQNGTLHLQQQLAMLVPPLQNNPIKIGQPVEPEEGGIQQAGPFMPDAIRSEFLTRLPAANARITAAGLDVRDDLDPSASQFGNRNIQHRKAQNSQNLAMMSEQTLATAASNLILDDLDPIYTYDLNGNRIAMIDPTGLTTYTYDALNRLTSITNNKGQTTEFAYDALGRRTSFTHANGVVTNYAYDTASQLTRLSHRIGTTIINSFDYTYDRIGNRKSKTDRTGSYHYAYDSLNRLTQASNPLPSNPLESFTYDPVGNRTNSNQNGSSVFNQANELLEDGNFTYEYDADGNMTQKTAKAGGTSATYEYDAENRLVRVVSSTGTVSNYKYDGIGRRVEKEVIAQATSIARYVYDNEDILLELNGSNAVTARYTHGPGVDEPLVMEKNGQSFFYHRDGLSSVTEISDQSGAVVQHYAYSTFGEIEFILDPGFNQPYTFTAREFDVETGLYYYRARYYEPSVGRFLQRDPIGFAAGPNAYTYVGNMPATFVDPLGLDYVDVAANYAAGMGDAMSFGITNYIRDRIGTNSVVDQCSWSYSAGSWTGFFHGIAWGGTSLLHGGGTTVLWSGAGTKQAANAAKGAGKLLTDTPLGKVLELVDDYVRLPKPVWSAASAIFAANAKGEVRVFVNNPSAQSVWNSVEKPILGIINRLHTAVGASPATTIVEVVVK